MHALYILKREREGGRVWGCGCECGCISTCQHSYYSCACMQTYERIGKNLSQEEGHKAKSVVRHHPKYFEIPEMRVDEEGNNGTIEIVSDGTRPAQGENQKLGNPEITEIDGAVGSGVGVGVGGGGAANANGGATSPTAAATLPFSPPPSKGSDTRMLLTPPAQAPTQADPPLKSVETQL